MTALVASMALLVGCYSNNCPLENTVLCNYRFYDMDGNAISYGDEITVSTLKPGWNDVYTYRKLGYQTIVLTRIDSTLIEEGYSMTQSVERKDTTLLNKISNATSMSVPMSYFNDADTLILTYASISNKDTIIVRQTNYPHVELPECGAYRFHKITGITSTDYAIDHVEIGSSEVNYEGRENIKIYFNGVAEQ